MDFRDYQAGLDRNHFWFKGKMGLVHDLLSQVITKQQPIKILNVGAGTGDDLSLIKKFGIVYVLDVDQQALDMIPDGIVAEKKCADVCSIPYESQSFDVVVAFDVMEHVLDDRTMINEIYRVLKPQGFYIFTVPAFNFLYSGHDQALHHFRRYNKKMIAPLMADFKKITQGYWFFFLFAPAALNRILCRKSKSLSIFRIPHLLNMLFSRILAFENWSIRHGLRYPFGLSLYGIYKK